MAGGRPTKLTQELLDKAKEYADGGYLKNEELFPSNAGLGLYVGVARSTIHKWIAENAEFSDIADQISQVQEQKLFTGGLLNEYNSSIAKLMLTKHGYTDKVQQDVTSNGETVKTFAELYGKPES